MTITQTVLEGDPAAAEGLVLQWHIGADMPPLRWDITYHVGAQPGYESIFSPRGNGWTHIYAYPRSAMDFGAFPLSEQTLRMGSTEEPMELGYEFYYTTQSLKNNQGFMARPVKSLRERMKPDQKRYQETVRLADYYNTYYLAGDWSLLMDGKGANEAVFQAFFSIPVPKDLLLNITLVQEQGHNLKAIFQNPPENAPTLRGVVTEDRDTVYFYFLPMEGALDTSLLPQGFGIYAAPYRSSRTPRIDATALSLVYPLPDPGLNITYFRLTEDEDCILLATCQEEVQTISLLRREGMEAVARTELSPETPLLRGIYQVAGDDGGYLAVFENDSFHLLVPNAQGALVTKMQGIFSPREDDVPEDLLNLLSPEEGPSGEPRPLNFRNYIFSMAAYDGTRLAVLRKDTSTQAVYLQVFDREGQTYLGRYDSSLTAFSYDDQEYLDRGYSGERVHEYLSQNYRLTWQELSP